MDDVSRGYFVLDTQGVIEAYHIATHHMLAHGWKEGEDTAGSLPGAPGSLSEQNKLREVGLSTEFENPIPITGTD